MNTFASANQRTNTIAASAKKGVPIAPHLLPNKAGQVGPVTVKSGIVNTALTRRK